MVCNAKLKCMVKARGAADGTQAGSGHPLFAAALDHAVMRYGLRRIYLSD